MQIGEAEIRSSEQCAAKIRFCQVGLVEIGAFEICFQETSPMRR